MRTAATNFLQSQTALTACTQCASKNCDRKDKRVREEISLDRAEPAPLSADVIALPQVDEEENLAQWNAESPGTEEEEEPQYFLVDKLLGNA